MLSSCLAFEQRVLGERVSSSVNIKMHCNKKRRTSIENDVRQFDPSEKKEMKRKSDPPPPSITDSEMTAMHVAAKYNNVVLLKSLLDTGHDANVKSTTGVTPLSLAAHFGNFDAVKLLLEHDADVFVVDSAGKSVLEFLLGTSSLPLNLVARLLNILMKCDVDVARKAEMLVRANCELKIVLYLKDARVTEEFLKRKYFIGEKESTVAVEFVMDRLELENVRVLLQFGVGVNVRREIFYRKLFDFCMVGERRNLKFAKVYLEKLAAWDVIVETALDDFYLLFGIGDTDIVELLLQCNVDECISQKLGQDLVAHVFENRKVDAIKLLQNRKFDVNAKGEGGSSSLHFAIRADSESNVRHLLDLGADVEIKNERGRTPLLEAVAYDRKKLVEILLQYGADVRAVIHDKFTVFDPFEKTFCPKLQEFFIAQLTVDKVMGIPIEDAIRKRINSNRKCKKFYNQCCRQIDDMQGAKITETFTLFTAVAGEIEEIAYQVRDEETRQLLDNYCRERKIHYYYYEMMRHKLDKAKTMVMPKCNFTMIITDDKGQLVDFEGMMIGDIDVRIGDDVLSK